jgi:hypothetical protein
MGLHLPEPPDPAHLLRRREREDAGRLLAWWRDLWRGLGDLRRALLAAIRGLRLPSERLGHPATLRYLDGLARGVAHFGARLAGLARQAQAFALALAGLGATVGAFAHGIGPGHLADGTPLDALGARYASEAVAATRKALLLPTIGHRALQQAIEPVKDRALLVGRQEVYRAYRAGALAGLREARLVAGWYWRASLGPRCCPVCIALHGSFHPLDEGFASHAGCRCIPVPGSQRVSGVDWFAAQDEDTQRAILGPGKFRLFQSGDLALPDLVAETDSPRWGPGRAERPLSDFV